MNTFPAYLSAVPSDVAGLVERLRHVSEIDFRPSPTLAKWLQLNAELRNEAATAISALSARPSVNETLERAAKKLEEMKRLLMSQTVVLDVTADCAVYDLAAAAIRKMKEPG